MIYKMKKYLQSNTTSCAFGDIFILKRAWTWCVEIMILIKSHVCGFSFYNVNPNKAGLYKGSFFGEGQFDTLPPTY